VTLILWIAIAATALVIPAHLVLFWFFLIRKPGTRGGAKPPHDGNPPPD
jgi:hypothetical protein